jgi:2-hydroxy-3-keto-5-methylthiopentenyl-1-phosphate phosphatase
MRPQNTIAIVYDFDGTLSPQPMQEYTLLPKLGITPDEFWGRVDQESRETISEKMLVYMRLVLELADEKKISISRQDFAAMAKDIKYFPGVESWFERINRYVEETSRQQVNVVHYIISAGMKEILEGVSIGGFFKQIYASEYHFNDLGQATFPKVLITDTSKTQYLFRVNKGKEALTESINEHMPEHERPIPFQNMIYIGDGMTDVPSMALTKKNGGHTIAVYGEGSTHHKKVCKDLLAARRVDFIAPADYRTDALLFNRMQLLLDSVVSGIAFRQEVERCKLENGLSPYA